MNPTVVAHDPFVPLLLSLLLFCVGAFASLLLRAKDRASAVVSGVCGAAAALAGLVASVPALTAAPATLRVSTPFAFADFVLRMDPLTALMVAVISLLALVASVYSVAYVREYEGRGVGAMGFFMNLFVASMVLVVTADNAFWFLVFFELMSLASYFVVIFDQSEEAVSAGFLYFVVAHAGSVLIMVAFFIMANYAGSFDFEAFRTAAIPAPDRSLIFLLGFLGFGAKAGIIPLHVWLPRAHPAAPSHASALMSGVMIKIGVFGILKVAVDLLGPAHVELWWGLLVLATGAISAVLGMVYALAEKDIKKLLAYCSVENVGIILLGVGVGLIGLATQQPVLAVVGLMAGLYHLVNHAVFKGLLFLGAGSVIYRTHTKDMDRMGGLARTMPWTAACFLTGALAISAIPPLNGFVSEWYIYQALFSAAADGNAIVRFAAPVAAVMLALTGALAVMCFVKAYGVVFSGASRNAHAHEVREVPASMVAGMVLLGLTCVLLAIAAPAVAPLLGSVAAATLGSAPTVLADGAALLAGSGARSTLSTPLVALLLVGMAALPVLLRVVLSGRGRLPARRSAAPWAAGYLPDAHMPATAGSLAQPIRMFFRPLYEMRRRAAEGWGRVDLAFDRFTALARRVEPGWDRRLIEPVVQGTASVGHRLQGIQGGDFRVYCLYIVVALIALLVVALI